MYKRVLEFTFLLLVSTSLSAMDLNETTVIINEATNATHVLQDKFNILVNEIPTTKEEISVEINGTVDVNKSIDTNESNISVRDNGCTNQNLGTSVQGLIIYKTKIKPYCEMSGDKFSKQYMQEDWEDIYHEKEFKMEVLKVCPHVEDSYKDKWTPHLYQFAIEYASDSDAIPEC